MVISQLEDDMFNLEIKKKFRRDIQCKNFRINITKLSYGYTYELILKSD